MVAHLHFLPTQKLTKKMQKSYQATAPGQTKMDRHQHDRKEGRSSNTGLAKVAVQYSANTFVVDQSLVLSINIFGENRHLRQARKRSTR